MKHCLIPLSFAVVMLACAGSAQAAPIAVANGWFRWLPAHLPAAGYFDLHNGRNKPITLTGADSPDCGALMLHKSEQKSGVDTMSDVSSVDVPAGGTLKFAPGGYHLMCMDPGPVLKPGATVTVRLHLASGQMVRANFAVRSPAGQ
jgi:periplasmic copper chaperone A